LRYSSIEMRFEKRKIMFFYLVQAKESMFFTVSIDTRMDPHT